MANGRGEEEERSAILGRAACIPWLQLARGKPPLPQACAQPPRRAVRELCRAVSFRGLCLLTCPRSVIMVRGCVGTIGSFARVAYTVFVSPSGAQVCEKWKHAMILLTGAQIAPILKHCARNSSGYSKNPYGATLR